MKGRTTIIIDDHNHSDTGNNRNSEQIIQYLALLRAPRLFPFSGFRETEAVNKFLHWQ